MKIRISVLIVLMLFLFTNSYSQQDINGWSWMNGKPTGNTLNWVKVIAPDNIVAVGARGTFIKSTDGGDTWSVNSQAGSPYNSPDGHGQTLPLNTGWFFDGNTGYVAGQSLSSDVGLISRTTNGGDSWTYIQYSGVGGTVRDMYFINSTTGYLTGNTNAKLFKTTDAGLTWTPNTNIPSNTYNGIYAKDENNIYTVTSLNKLIYTNDAGVTWNTQTLPGNSATLTSIVFKDVNTGYVSGNGNYFAYTTNGGTTWTQSNSSSTVGQQDLSYSGGILYMAGDYQYIYKSSNNGVNWTPVYFRDNSNPNQPPYSIVYSISVNGSDIAVVGINGSVTISNDGGSSWRNKNYSVTNDYSELYSSIFVQPSGSIYIGPNGGGKILYSSNGGSNWTTLNSVNTGAVYGIQFLNANTGFVCGSLGHMSKTINGGNTWTTLSLPSPMNSYQLNNLYFLNTNTGWVAGLQGPFSPALIFKTTDGGVSWNSPQNIETNPNGSAVTVQMADANKGFALFSPASLFSTTNGGTNWIKTTDPYVLSTQWNTMFVMSKDIIFLAGEGTSNVKKVIRTTDGGSTWTDLTSNLLPTCFIFDIKWLNLKHGIISAAGGYMAKTTNGGLNWTATNTGGSSSVECSFPNKNLWMTVSDRNGSFQAFKKTENVTSISLNVTMGIEGFWNGKPMVTDTVTVQLRNAAFPYALVEESKEVVNINGFATYEFYTATSGSYYVVLKHRNSLETWSAAPVAMSAAGNYYYDFTTSASQAFGSNTVLKSGIYCDYSGDVNQDGTIDASDLASVENNVGNSGYIPEDVTGDDYADAADVAIVENNQGISTVNP